MDHSQIGEPHFIKRFRIRRLSGHYFPAFELNTEILMSKSSNSVRMRVNTDYKKLQIRHNVDDDEIPKQ